MTHCAPPPLTLVEPRVDMFHGLQVEDPYYWLEDQRSTRTRTWIDLQTQYARSYLDSIPNRRNIVERVKEFLGSTAYDSVNLVGDACFFRKRAPFQEQPRICMHKWRTGPEEVLIDPSGISSEPYTAVLLRLVSSSGRYLLYEVKKGGERMGRFKVFDVEARVTLIDSPPARSLSGFVFGPDDMSYLYSYSCERSAESFCSEVKRHVLGTPMKDDITVFRSAGHCPLQIALFGEGSLLGLQVRFFASPNTTDFYIQDFNRSDNPLPIVKAAAYRFTPLLCQGRVFAVTNCQAPNSRIVEVTQLHGGETQWRDVVPETADRIHAVSLVADTIAVSYLKNLENQIEFYDLAGRSVGHLRFSRFESVRLIPGAFGNGDVLYEHESFTTPKSIRRCTPSSGGHVPWLQGSSATLGPEYDVEQVQYASLDGTVVPMFLVGRREVLEGKKRPTVMTAYGGFASSMGAHFSAFTAILMELGFLFALPNIRGGGEFGPEWHEAARKHHRQRAIDDFVAAAEWLIQSGRAAPDRIAIFGGSNAGLLVGAALTQRPHLYRAVVCMAPLLDMLRYHRHDPEPSWEEEYGNSENEADFQALLRYSPYEAVKAGTCYPATLIVSGDADGTCHPAHARKMTARLQAASASGYPVLLEYRRFRGHVPVLPLSERIEALTDRVAFLCDQLGVQTWPE